MSDIKDSYDKVPYLSSAHAESHPQRIAAIATLFGLNPVVPKNARILEIGSACGNNLLPIAMTLPEATCVGIELSQVQVDKAIELQTEAEIKNTTFHCLDMMDIDKDFGTFDYIIAHGIYSWVPAEVRDKIFEICQNNLSKNGVAYISYNTYPGWHERMAVREMMVYHARGFSDPNQAISQARSLLQFVSKAVPTTNTSYKSFLENGYKAVKKMPEWYFFHDYLEHENAPCLFSEFVEKASGFGLQYLGDANLRNMVPYEFAPEVKEKLIQISKTTIALEQYLDFLRNNPFRTTLLCRSEKTLTRSLAFDIMRKLHFRISTFIKAVDDSQVGADAQRSICECLLEASHHCISYKKLFELVKKKNSFSEEEFETALRQCVFAQLVIPTFGETEAVSPKTKGLFVSPLLRAQAKRGVNVTNYFHESVELDNLSIKILSLMDGTRTESEIVAEVEASYSGIDNLESKTKETLRLMSEKGLIF